MAGKNGLLYRDEVQDVDLNPLGQNNLRCRRQGSKPSWAPVISVIVPAYNEEDYIGLTLDSVNRQNYGFFEIIVVANGCTDRTAAIAVENCNRLIVLSSKCVGVARNLGAKLARGDLLMFLDADTWLEPGALEIIADKFTRACAVGTFRGCPDSDRFAHRAIYRLKNFIHRWSIHAGSSGVIVCWKKHFIATHGFDEALEVRENSHLIQRLKRFGRYRYVSETTATTSMRRYQRAGTRRTICLWLKLWCQSIFGDLRWKSYEAVR
jgi:glycosyltransferase involved in cell wall biosynthesis